MALYSNPMNPKDPRVQRVEDIRNYAFYLYRKEQLDNFIPSKEEKVQGLVSLLDEDGKKEYQEELSWINDRIKEYEDRYKDYQDFKLQAHLHKEYVKLIFNGKMYGVLGTKKFTQDQEIGKEIIKHLKDMTGISYDYAEGKYIQDEKLLRNVSKKPNKEIIESLQSDRMKDLPENARKSAGIGEKEAFEELFKSMQLRPKGNNFNGIDSLYIQDMKKNDEKGIIYLPLSKILTGQSKDSGIEDNHKLPKGAKLSTDNKSIKYKGYTFEIRDVKDYGLDTPIPKGEIFDDITKYSDALRKKELYVVEPTDEKSRAVYNGYIELIKIYEEKYKDKKLPDDIDFFASAHLYKEIVKNNTKFQFDDLKGLFCNENFEIFEDPNIMKGFDIFSKEHAQFKELDAFINSDKMNSVIDKAKDSFIGIERNKDEQDTGKQYEDDEIPEIPDPVELKENLIPNIYNLFSQVEYEDGEPYYQALSVAGLSHRFDYFLKQSPLKEKLEASNTLKEFTGDEEVKRVFSNISPLLDAKQENTTESNPDMKEMVIKARWVSSIVLAAKDLGKDIDAFTKDEDKFLSIDDINKAVAEDNKVLYLLSKTAENVFGDETLKTQLSSVDLENIDEDKLKELKDSVKGKIPASDKIPNPIEKQDGNWAKYNAMNFAITDNLDKKSSGYEVSKEMQDYASGLRNEVADEFNLEPEPEKIETETEIKKLPYYDTSAADLAKKLKPYNTKAGVKFLDNLLRYMNKLEITVPKKELQNNNDVKGSDKDRDGENNEPPKTNDPNKGQGLKTAFSPENQAKLIKNGFAELVSGEDENGTYLEYNGERIYPHQNQQGKKYFEIDGKPFVLNDNKQIVPVTEYTNAQPGSAPANAPASSQGGNGQQSSVVNNFHIHGNVSGSNFNSDGSSAQGGDIYDGASRGDNSPKNQYSEVVESNKELLQNEIILDSIKAYAEQYNGENKEDLQNLVKTIEGIYTKNSNQANEMITIPDPDDPGKTVITTKLDAVKMDMIRVAVRATPVTHSHLAETWEKINIYKLNDVISNAVIECAKPRKVAYKDNHISYGQEIVEAMGDLMSIKDSRVLVEQFKKSPFYTQTMKNIMLSIENMGKDQQDTYTL